MYMFFLLGVFCFDFYESLNLEVLGFLKNFNLLKYNRKERRKMFFYLC